MSPGDLCSHLCAGILLALIAREHVYIEGPPGTAKTMLAEATAPRSTAVRVVLQVVSNAVGLDFFFYQLHRDTRLSELVGDMVVLREKDPEQEGGEVIRTVNRPGGILTSQVVPLHAPHGMDAHSTAPQCANSCVCGADLRAGRYIPSARRGPERAAQDPERTAVRGRLSIAPCTVLISVLAWHPSDGYHMTRAHDVSPSQDHRLPLLTAIATGNPPGEAGAFISSVGAHQMN